MEVRLIHHLPKLRLLTLTDEFSECHVYLLLGLSATIGSLLGNRARDFVNREVRFAPLRLCLPLGLHLRFGVPFADLCRLFN